MIRKRDAAAVVGVGAACAACCAGPIVGVVAAIGLGTLAGVLIFGAAGLAIAAGVSAIVLIRRRQRRAGRPRPERAHPQRSPSAGKWPAGSTR